MSWPPQIGDPLPRAELAWCEPAKVEDWVLGPMGHGREWARVFCVGAEDWVLVWRAIAFATAGAMVHEVRDRRAFGVVCGVKVDLAIGSRTAPATLSWHYHGPTAAPRLVTAYLTL